LKSVSIKSFVSTEAAHSTAAFLTVKLFSKISFLLNRLRLRSDLSSRQREAHSTALNHAVNTSFPTSFASGEPCEAEPPSTFTNHLTH
ncbi:hypothetical protein PSH28_23375, partial [Pseudomonas resinovorans]|nr:hypothetical protein [Pseudomonas resinovorans]